MRRRLLAVVAGPLMLLASVGAGPAYGAEQKLAQHCVTSVVYEPAEKNEFTCFGTFDAAMRSLGASKDGQIMPDDVDTARRSGSTALGMGVLSIIAIHYKNTGFSGGSLTVNGGVCNGGTVDFAYSNPGWNDEIESMHYYCGGPFIYSFYHTGCTGSYSANTSHVSTFYSMNNQFTCIQYGP